jgi:hypothetical protein
MRVGVFTPLLSQMPLDGLCRCLCRNPAILTRIAGDYSVSLCVTCRRHDVRQGRMDIGSQYHLLSFRVAPSDSGPRFDTVEVRSSSLLVPQSAKVGSRPRCL